VGKLKAGKAGERKLAFGFGARGVQRICGKQGAYHAAGDKNKALLTFWVLKEAQAKCTGEGLSYPPKPTAFSLEDPRVQIIDGCLVAVIEEEPYAV
jgi:hypothetical protein